MKRLLIVTSLILSSLYSTAVPLPAPGSGNASPIDSSILFLVAAGIVIGTVFLLKLRPMKQAPNNS